MTVAKPDAWQYRYIAADGAWSPWTPIQASDVHWYESQSTFSPGKYEVRPLYTAASLAAITADRDRLREALTRLLSYAEGQTCSHDETERLGFIWESCRQCGAKWADDEGGMPEYVEPKQITAARKALESQ